MPRGLIFILEWITTIDSQVETDKKFDPSTYSIM